MTNINDITILKKEYVNKLEAIFGFTCDCSIKLFEQLHELELRASSDAELWNKCFISNKQYVVCTNIVEHNIVGLLGDRALKKIYINRRWRGYALKIRGCVAKGFSIHYDEEGEGILAPDFETYNKLIFANIEPTIQERSKNFKQKKE
jgi:hypothetical protein